MRNIYVQCALYTSQLLLRKKWSMWTDSLKTVSSVRLHCNSRPVNYTFNSLTKYKEAIIRKTVAHAIAICLSKQYFRIISRNDYNQMPALRGMIQRFCTPTSCFSFRARVQGWTISFVFNSVKKRKKKRKEKPWPHKWKHPVREIRQTR